MARSYPAHSIQSSVAREPIVAKLRGPLLPPLVSILPFLRAERDGKRKVKVERVREKIKVGDMSDIFIDL